MKKILTTIVLFGLMAVCYPQSSVREDSRMQQVEKIFRNALIKNFIHPNQLDEKNWTQCKSYINNLLEKFEEDFIDVRFEKAFKSSSVTNYFSPIFIYEDGREFSFPAFKIMQ